MTETDMLEPSSVWHEGEILMQESVGVDRVSAAKRAQVIRDHMPDQHRNFYHQLSFVVLGSVDKNGQAWATLGAGRPGFISSPDAQKLDVNLVKDPADPAMRNLVPGEGFGMLGIELHTRRRNRLNGHITAADGQQLHFAVEHSFGNCPRYIQKRDFEFTREPETITDQQSVNIDGLNAEARAIIAKADTFFVSSFTDVGVKRRQIDVSHRGGKPGFVRVDADGTLTIPDFAGNLYFNTLGNLLINPKAGLLFPDFENGTMLHLTGGTEVVLDSPEVASFQGAERIWKFRPAKMVLRPDALPIRWITQEDGRSPSSINTGQWHG